MRMKAHIPVLLLAVFTCVEAAAFGATGHMSVGSIADRLVEGTAAGRNVRRILGTSLKTAAVWADCAKGVAVPSFKYGGDGEYAECEVYENPASKAQMESFVRRNHDNCASPHNVESCHKQYHYTDVAVQRDAYSRKHQGTSDQDVVAAIGAAIEVLRGNAAPAPFRISGKREALRMLAHYVGDIHQPLHVASVYLDANGRLVDPDKGAFDYRTETRGGNDLVFRQTVNGKQKTVKLHGAWDSVPRGVMADATAAQVKAAGQVEKTPGSVETWPAAWATESLRLGAAAFDGVTFGPEGAKNVHETILPEGYRQRREDIQREQVVRAGARLAHVLAAIWP